MSFSDHAIALHAIDLNPGETVLLICPMCTAHIRELEPAASEDLLARLFDHVTQADNVHRHDWYTGDIFVWDNHPSAMASISASARTSPAW